MNYPQYEATQHQLTTDEVTQSGHQVNTDQVDDKHEVTQCYTTPHVSLRGVMSA